MAINFAGFEHEPGLGTCLRVHTSLHFEGPDLVEFMNFLSYPS
jgi:hypothetical protein